MNDEIVITPKILTREVDIPSVDDLINFAGESLLANKGGDETRKDYLWRATLEVNIALNNTLTLIGGFAGVEEHLGEERLWMLKEVICEIAAQASNFYQDFLQTSSEEIVGDTEGTNKTISAKVWLNIRDQFVPTVQAAINLTGIYEFIKYDIIPNLPTKKYPSLGEITFATGEIVGNVKIQNKLGDLTNPTLLSKADILDLLSKISGVSKDYVDDQDLLLQKQITSNNIELATKADINYVDGENAKQDLIIKQNTTNIKKNEFNINNNSLKLDIVDQELIKNRDDIAEETKERKDRDDELKNGLKDESNARINKDNDIDAVNDAQQAEITDLQKTRALLVNNAFNVVDGDTITVSPGTSYNLIYKANDPNSLMETNDEGMSYDLKSDITLLAGSYLYGTHKIALDLESGTDFYDEGEVQYILNGVIISRTELSFAVAQKQYFTKVNTFQYEVKENLTEAKLEIVITATKGRYSATLDEGSYYTITTKNPGEASFEATTSNIIDDGQSQYKGQKLSVALKDLDDRDTALEKKVEEMVYDMEVQEISPFDSNPQKVITKYPTDKIVGFLISPNIYPSSCYNISFNSIMFDEYTCSAIVRADYFVDNLFSLQEYSFSGKENNSFIFKGFTNNNLTSEIWYKYLAIMYKIPKSMVKK